MNNWQRVRLTQSCKYLRSAPALIASSSARSSTLCDYASNFQFLNLKETSSSSRWSCGLLLPYLSPLRFHPVSDFIAKCIFYPHPFGLQRATVRRSHRRFATSAVKQRVKFCYISIYRNWNENVGVTKIASSLQTETNTRDRKCQPIFAARYKDITLSLTI